MNLLEDSSVIILIIYLALLGAAAVEDMLRLTISNLTVIGIALLAVVAAVIAGPELDLWKNLLMCIGLLVVGTFLFASGKFGGGDVKLLAVNALWFDLLDGMKYVAAALISGGVLALLFILARTTAPAGLRSRFQGLRKGAGIPYGIAIVAGAIVTLVIQRS